jgi:endonuclease-3
MDVEKIVIKLRRATEKMVPPASVTIVSHFGRDPFLVLIGCILSLRTKDTVSLPASLRLFERATTPQELLKISTEAIASIIYPVGFYRRKAQTIHNICAELLSRFNGAVPNRPDKLMSLPGVGLKTANLVLGEGFGIPALCVDTHVHRISNRLGIVKTKTPEETEAALRAVLPQKYWIEWGRLLVMLGQNICVPISPKCSICPIRTECKRIGVIKSR